MRILFLTQYYPPEFGAACIHTERIARMMTEEGHHVTVLTGMPNYPTGIVPPAYKGKFLHHETRQGIDVRRIWVYATPNKRARARMLNQISFMVMTALRGIFLARPDVILVESHPLFVCLTGGWLKRIKRAPIVLNVSDLWPASAVAVGALRADSTIVKYAEKVERWAYRDAAHVVAMAEGQRMGIRKVVAEDKISLIMAATDLVQFQPHNTAGRREIRQRYSIGEDEFVVSHIGNMSLAHDFELIMDVVKALPGVRFLFAGGGSSEAYVRERIVQDGVTNVVMTGILPHTDMPAMWAASDVTLIALKAHEVFEGVLPTKMFEALATGTPIVAAAQGEAELLIQRANAGIPVPFEDRAAMIAAIQRLQMEPAVRAAMVANERAYAEQVFSPERIRRDFLAIFNRVVAEHQEGGRHPQTLKSS